jgi:hypothetical protein
MSNAFNAVLYSWHKEHCSDPCLQMSHDNILVCSTCGEYVQPKIGKEVADFMEDVLLNGPDKVQE